MTFKSFMACMLLVIAAASAMLLARVAGETVKTQAEPVKPLGYVVLPGELRRYDDEVKGVSCYRISNYQPLSCVKVTP